MPAPTYSLPTDTPLPVSKTDRAAPAIGVLRRALGNAGLLLGGTSAGGLMQLAVLAILAHELGLQEFGIFSIVTAQSLLVSGLVAFDSDQAVVRYGVIHLGGPNHAAIKALFKMGVLLDSAAACAAAMAAIGIAPLLGARLGWNADVIFLAQLCAPLAFGNVSSTPKGMLRLFNRFDLLSIQTTVTPAVRLVSTSLLAMFHLPLAFYVAAWVAAGWIGAAVALLFAWREVLRSDPLPRHAAAPANPVRLNPGFVRFALLSHLNSSVALVPKHLSVLIVAAILGAPAAGMFKIAREAAWTMMKPAMLFNSALYPELARLVAARSWIQLSRAAARSSAGAAALGLIATLLMICAGPRLIGLLLGARYAPAAPLLAAVGFATSIRALALAADPILYALGHPHFPLGASITSSILFLGVMFWRLPLDGLAGAGWAFVAMALLGATLSGFLAWRSLERERRLDPAASAA